MEYRRLGKTGYEVSAVGFGGWAIGGAWGNVPENDAMAALHAAVDAGVTFFDTADVYGDGRSERFIARLHKERPDAPMVVATKAGRRLDPHVVDGYNAQNLTAFVARSLKNLETDSIDLLQLHCPPTEAYYRPELFGILDDMVSDGLIRHYGVSVEKVEEALKAIEYPGVSTVQIIFNAFRQRPAGLFFGEAKKRDVGVIVRVPLASGLLSGKMNRKSTFAADDHRSFNRRGEAFDRGETFAGVDFNSGLEAVEELRPLVPQGATMAQLALRWILMFDAVSTVIPGARNTEQATQNAAAADLAPLSKKAMAKITEIYETRIKDQVHHRW
jgi:aryl-alcohol dehydrogenase-like predicted oxidoreductase